MFIFGLKPTHYLTCILASSLIPLNILMNGCNSQPEQKPKFGRWEIVRQSDWKTRFYDVFFIDQQIGWAVGNSEGNSIDKEFNSIIAHTSDGGQHWIPQESGTFYPLRKVQFIDNQNGWIIGENGIILKTNDGGGHWYRQESNTSNNLFDLHFFTNKTGWIIGDYRTILRTKDGGITWINQELPYQDASLRGLHFLDHHHGWIVTYEGSIYATTDGGHNWKNQKTNIRYELSDVYFADKNIGWIVGDKRTVLHTTNGGIHWNYITEGSNQRHETSYGQKVKTGD